MMVLHPETVERAHMELDEFIKSNQRLPSLEDKKQLPFLDCILKEVYRYVSSLIGRTNMIFILKHHYSIHPPAPVGEYPNACEVCLDYLR